MSDRDFSECTTRSIGNAGNLEAPARAFRAGEDGSTVAVEDDELSLRRVLFVTAQSEWRRQIENEFQADRPDWVGQHASDAPEALELLTAAPHMAVVVDAVVADGLHLLETVVRQFPAVLRLVRCGVKERASVAKWSRLGVTLIGPDIDASALVGTLLRAERLQGWMSDPAIGSLLAQFRILPARPELYSQVTEELQSPAGSMETVAGFIAQDPIMSAKILQVANSAFFGLPYEICEPAQAVMFLGAERTRSLILLASMFSQLDGKRCPQFSPEKTWNHSLQVGAYARAIAMSTTRDARLAEAAFTAGLLHDVGKLMLAANLPEAYSEVAILQSLHQMPWVEAERQIIGTTHAEIGACLLGTWGIPLATLESTAWHHSPELTSADEFSPLTAVHASNVFAQEAEQGRARLNGALDRINLDYLTRLGLADHPERWREMCGV